MGPDVFGCSIQRLLIVYLNLAELCTGKPLHEAATDEEVSESILYFHQECRDSSDGFSLEARFRSKEAIHFAGLCTALYRLPSSVNSACQEATEHVYLENCTLVFLPLEQPHVIAVVQIARSSQLSALSVDAAIRRSHSLFQLLRGGGIERRLVRNECSRLYALRKGIRTETSASSESNRLKDELEKLVSASSLTKLREELGVHYDSFLADATALERRDIMQLSSHSESLPTILSPYDFVELSSWLRDGLESINSKGSSLLAISSYRRGQLVSTEAARDVAVSNETADYLMTYMASFYNMNRNIELDTCDGKPPKHNLLPLAFSMVEDRDESTFETTSELSGFVKAPPLSMMSATDCRDELILEDGSVSWAPLVAIRWLDNWHDCRIAWYVRGDISFLLYLQAIGDLLEEAPIHGRLLREFNSRVSATPSCVRTVLDKPVDCGTQRPWHEPGQDVIIIDGPNQRVSLLLSQSTSSVSNGKNKGGQGKVWFLGGKQHDAKAPSQAGCAAISKSSFDLHCRYCLSSELSLDAILAFDDAASQLHNGTTEVCTLLRKRWLHARSDGKRQIYVFFNSKLYSTISDVQAAAESVRNAMLG